MTILHLSDLHFGWDGEDPNKIADRKLCLDGLISAVGSLGADWRPSIICISGDVGWLGASSDYAEAKKWLDVLLAQCGISYDRVIVCAGNHDVCRDEAMRNARPVDCKEADDVLKVPVPSHLLKPFDAFINFCQACGIIPAHLGEEESYLVGERVIDGFRFVVLNSAWFSKDDADKGKLWLGYPQMRILDANSQLPEVYDKGKAIQTISLLHHPKEWFHQEDCHAWGIRPNPWDYLAWRCHILLTGHDHGEVRPPDRIADAAHHFTGGSAYNGANHFNTFRLIRITDGAALYRSFGFDPRSANNRWYSYPADTVSFARGTPSGEIQQRESGPDLTKLRLALGAHAQRVVLQKSRLLRPTGGLPKTVPQQVSVRISNLTEIFDSSRKLLRDRRNDQTMSVYEAARRNRCTLVLGDLGSGKSTMVGSLVTETMDRSQTSVSMLIPLKSLKISGQFSTEDLLQAVDSFIGGEAAPTFSGTSIRKLLDVQTEILLVFDGLDELNQEIASRFLRQAASLPRHWPTIQIVASGRPIELVGVAYEDWGIARTIALDDDSKRRFIVEELLADGISQIDAEAKSLSFLQTLKEFTSLDRLAETPLAVRLIYPRLKSISGPSIDSTLGDLLYDVLLDRLGRWQQRDDKPKTFDSFEDAFPTPEAKARMLGVLAKGMSSSPPLTEDGAKSRLREVPTDSLGGKKDLIADQALEYYKSSGLITSERLIEFPIQPLWEMVSAINLASEWSVQSSGWILPPNDQWRIVSFAGTVIRRRGWLSRLREPVVKFIQAVLEPTKSPNVPAACYVVQETLDKTVAIEAIECFSLLEPRPLGLFNDEWDVSANNIARTIWLAGDLGFNWLYNEYLNPRYPLLCSGSAIIQRVMENWTAAGKGRLSDEEQRKLSAIVKPYLAAGEGNFFGILGNLAILVPDAFDKEDRLWNLSRMLDREPLGSHSAEVLLAASGAGEKDIVNEILLANASDHPRTALMWCETNKDQDLPIHIIEATFKSIAKNSNKSEASSLENACRSRLGEQAWLAFARWILSDQTSDAATGAAIVLHKAVHERLTLLGIPLLEGMHDGGYVAEAERILQLLVIKEGDEGLRWLVHQMARHPHHWSSHSGCWRILLAQVENLTDGPQLLASCMSALGPFTLSRYPEIREGFRRVLNGKHGQEFREVFMKQLHSLNPEVRRGISVTLVSADCNAYPEALVVAIQGRASLWLHHDWFEWERFCLSLSFRASVLDFLRNHLEDLEPLARSLALAILVKGGMRIEDHYISELSSSLLDLGNWSLDIDALGEMGLKSEESFEFLWKEANGSHAERAERAASRLIDGHNEKLTLAQQAKCIALVTKPRLNQDISRLLLRIHHDHDFAEALNIACDEITKQHGKRPFLKLVHAAIVDNASWKDVVWMMLCDDSSFGGIIEADSNGYMLLEFGRQAPDHARLIGDAARECFDDPRVEQNRWIDAHHWLAVIADEFVGPSPDLIRVALRRGGPIHGAAQVSLIARLGEVPLGAIFGHRAEKRPGRIAPAGPPTNLDKEQIVDLLREYSRESDSLHPSVNAALERALFFAPVLDEQLSAFAGIGKPGIVIALVLRYCYGLPPKIVESIPLLDSGVFSPLHQPQEQHK